MCTDKVFALGILLGSPLLARTFAAVILRLVLGLFIYLGRPAVVLEP